MLFSMGGVVHAAGHFAPQPVLTLVLIWNSAKRTKRRKWEVGRGGGVPIVIRSIAPIT
jgi:hypothetical protein